MVLTNIPFLGHHENTLNEQALENLRTNSLEETWSALIINDELHNFDETLERFAVSSWRWLGLQADLGNNERLGGDRGQCFRHGAESCLV